MATLSIRRGSFSVYPCGCCGRITRSLHGFVMTNGIQRGLYLAEHTPGHERGVTVDMALALDDASTIAVRIEADGERIQMRVLSPSDVSWHPALMLGGWIPRTDARARLYDVKRLVERILSGDARLRGLLEVPPPTRRAGRAA